MMLYNEDEPVRKVSTIVVNSMEDFDSVREYFFETLKNIAGADFAKVEGASYVASLEKKEHWSATISKQLTLHTLGNNKVADWGHIDTTSNVTLICSEAIARKIRLRRMRFFPDLDIPEKHRLKTSA